MTSSQVRFEMTSMDQSDFDEYLIRDKASDKVSEIQKTEISQSSMKAISRNVTPLPR